MLKKSAFFFLFINLFISLEISAQEIELTITSINNEENLFLKKITSKKRYRDTVEIQQQLNHISRSLKSYGYFLNSLDSVVQKKKKYKAYFTLNKKIEFLRITIPTEEMIGKIEIKLPTNKIEIFLDSISKKLETQGYSFSKIQLKNFKIKKTILYTDLEIQKSKKRIINKVIYKNYKKFPKKFSKHYLNIKKNTIFNQKKIKEISALTKKLDFVKEIKPPEVLFKKDSTLLYLYLDKSKNNTFDGLINFASTETGSILFNGHLDIKLTNTLNKGETFKLFWNRFENESQELEVSTYIPYIFNAKLSPEIEFSIFKQDSTFTNTKFNLINSYQINTKSNIRLTINSENSNYNLNLNDNLESYKSTFFGAGYKYQVKNTDIFNSDKLLIEFDILFGNRKTNTSNNQIKLASNISYIINIHKRGSVYLGNKVEILNSNNFLQNELFRIGGINSIRGFNNKSIFASEYLTQNIEYRFLTSKTSYFYSITDFAIVKNNAEEKLYGLGLGYVFISNNSKINISSAIGNSLNDNFNFKKPQLLISWVTLF